MSSQRESGLNGVRTFGEPLRQRRAWWREPLFGALPYTKREQGLGLVIFLCGLGITILPAVRAHLSDLLVIALPAWFSAVFTEVLALRRRGRVRLSVRDPRWSWKRWSTLQALSYPTLVLALGLVDGFVLGHRDLHVGTTLAIVAAAIGVSVTLGRVEPRAEGGEPTRASN